MIARPPTASSYVMRTEAGPSAAEDQPVGDLSAVRKQRVYQVDNPDEVGAKLNVEPEELERGFEYGRTAVHISEAESNIVNLETTQSLELIGFVQEEKVNTQILGNIHC